MKTKTIIYTCDKCGKESTDKLISYVGVHVRTSHDHIDTLGSANHFPDLCEECGAYLYENLENVFNAWIKSNPNDKFIMCAREKPDNLKLLVDTLAKDFIGKAARIRAGRTEDNSNKIYIEGYFDEKTLVKMASSILTTLEGA